jgi:hypothetical protein
MRRAAQTLWDITTVNAMAITAMGLFLLFLFGPLLGWWR